MRDSSSRTLRKYRGIVQAASRSAIPLRSSSACLRLSNSGTNFQPTAKLALACAALVLIAARTSGDQGWEGHSLYAIWENDAIRASDRHYTQGSKLGYLSSDRATPKWLNRWSNYIPALGLEPEASKFGIEIGQEIYTPEDLDAVDLIPDDRPYAGWLYSNVRLQRRGTGPANIPVMESFGFDLGVIGPESFAEDTQKVWHSRDPSGWHHQLETEIGFNLRYDRSYLFRFNRGSPWTVDGIPALDAGVGTVDIHFGLSGTVRVGYNVPDRFEVPIGITKKKFGVYAFLRTGGRLVLRNIFLDGNTWTPSHSVEKNHWVGDLSSGFTIVLKSFELTLSNNYRTREFHGQDRADSYGSATLSFKF